MKPAMKPEECQLLKAAEELLTCIERMPGGYDYRPYYTFSRNPLVDPTGAVLRLQKAVKAFRSDDERLQEKQ